MVNAHSGVNKVTPEITVNAHSRVNNVTPEITVNAHSRLNNVTPEVNTHSCVYDVENLPSPTYSSILESVSSSAKLYWERRIALAAPTDATKVNSVMSSDELSTITESEVPIVIDEVFESETGKFDHHTSDNAISENLSVLLLIILWIFRMFLNKFRCM